MLSVPLATYVMSVLCLFERAEDGRASGFVASLRILLRIRNDCSSTSRVVFLFALPKCWRSSVHVVSGAGFACGSQLYCPLCQEAYEVRDGTKEAKDIDGAFFGPSFPHIFLQTFVNLVGPIDCSVEGRSELPGR